MWMGITTGGIGKIQLSTTQASGKAKDETEKNDSFASIMELTGQNTVDVQTELFTDRNIKTAAPKENDTTVKADKTAKAETSTKPDNTDKRDIEKTDDFKTKAYDRKRIAESNSEAVQEIEPEDLKAALTEVIQKIVDLLQDILDMTPEEIQDAMDDISIVPLDLLVPKQVQDFVLQAEDATEVDLLIREDLSQLISDITTEIQNVADEYKITGEDTEFYKTLIQEVPVKTDAEITEQANDKSGGPEEMAAPQAEQQLRQPEKTSQPQEVSKKEEAEPLIKIEADADIVYEAKQDEQPAQQESGRNGESSVAAALNDALRQVDQTVPAEQITDFQADIQQADILRQVVEAVRVNMSRESTSMTLQLNPENLGRVQISVSQRNGVMQAQIIAENEAAKQAIEGNLAVLRESLNHQELRVESVEVTIASYEFFEQQEAEYRENERQQSGRRSGGLGMAGGEEPADEADITEESKMRAQGSSVSYTI